MFDDYSRKNLKNLANSSAATESIFENAVDVTTNALMVITRPHQQIHVGRHFFYQTVVPALGASATKNYILRTPDEVRFAHFNFEIDVEQDTTLVITEDVTSSGEDNITVPNNNRNSAIVNTTSLSEDASSISGGTVLLTQRKGDGVGINTIGGIIRSDGEIILKRDAKYSIQITNNGGSAEKVNICLFWYENALS
jgi:hypothetical protein